MSGGVSRRLGHSRPRPWLVVTPVSTEGAGPIPRNLCPDFFPFQDFGFFRDRPPAGPEACARRCFRGPRRVPFLGRCVSRGASARLTNARGRTFVRRGEGRLAARRPNARGRTPAAWPPRPSRAPFRLTIARGRPLVGPDLVCLLLVFLVSRVHGRGRSRGERTPEGGVQASRTHSRLEPPRGERPSAGELVARAPRLGGAGVSTQKPVGTRRCRPRLSPRLSPSSPDVPRRRLAAEKKTSIS